MFACSWDLDKTDFSKCYENELYNHTQDTGIPYDVEHFENTNIAATEASLTLSLLSKLRQKIQQYGP